MSEIERELRQTITKLRLLLRETQKWKGCGCATCRDLDARIKAALADSELS